MRNLRVYSTAPNRKFGIKSKDQGFFNLLTMIGLGLFVLNGCVPFSPLVQLNPPAAPAVLLHWDMVSDTRARLEFSSPVQPLGVDQGLWSNPEPYGYQVMLLDESSSSTHHTTLMVEFTSQGPSPGESITLQGTVEDLHGNRLAFSAPVFGYNPYLPTLVINEIRGVNSSTRVEAIEILAATSGHLGGATIVVGNPQEPNQGVRLPPIEVEEGTFIVLHFRAPAGSITDPYGNYGNPPPDSPELDGVINLYTEGGLSATGELILLARDPRMIGFLDGVMYTNKTNNPEDRFRGFGTRAALEKAEFFARTGLWYGGGLPAQVDPEDFPTSLGMTVTRTLNRRPYEEGEPRSKHQWYICATGQGSIGEVNSLLEHSP